MNLGECTKFAERVLDDVRSTEDEKILAKRLLGQARESNSAKTISSVTGQLRKLLRDIEQRGHRAIVRSEETAGHASLAWINLNQELNAAERQWTRLANIQFWLGVLTAPLALVGVGLIQAAYPPASENARSLVLSFLVGAAVTHSFLVLRIHQQARQAAERIVEKRVGLAFLRIAVEDHAGGPEFDGMVRAGTQMFLGHHAAATVPLGPEDLRSLVLPAKEFGT